MKNKFLLVWSFLIAFSATAFAQNEPEKGDVPAVPDVFEQLEEVVVTAGGIAREKKALGFGVEEVKGASIKESGESNIVSGISAKVSGVQVTNSSGAAGAASYIKIRGNATFTANDNQPLMVVDGVPIDNSQIATSDLRAVLQTQTVQLISTQTTSRLSRYLRVVQLQHFTVLVVRTV